MSKIFLKSNIGYNFLGIQYDLGAYREVPGTRGISHLMEHLIIKSFKSKIEQLRSLGIDWNAYTSDSRILIYFSGLQECLDSISNDLFSLIIGNEAWTEEEFDNEKLTVLQEYEDSFNDQINGSLLNFIRKFYNYYSPIGCREDIEKFSYEHSLLFRDQFKKPSNIIEVGQQSTIEFNNYNTDIVVPNKFSFGPHNVQLEDVPKENKTIFGFIGNQLYDKELKNKLNMITNLLSGDLDSPFYREIREKRGLSYFSYGCINYIGRDITPLFFSCTTNDRAAELKEVYQTLFSTKFDELVSKNDFDVLKNNILINKKKDTILPHSGVFHLLVDKTYEGMDEFTYEEAISLASDVLNPEKLQEIEY